VISIEQNFGPHMKQKCATLRVGNSAHFQQIIVLSMFADPKPFRGAVFY
jgi:hypothetical protein